MTGPLEDVIASVLERIWEQQKQPGGTGNPEGRTEVQTYHVWEVLNALGAETQEEWGIRFGDGEIDDGYKFASDPRESVERYIQLTRDDITAGHYDADDYEPMTAVSRTVTTIPALVSEWIEVQP